MSAGSDFDDTIKICEFYSTAPDEVVVDLENFHIRLGEYDIDPVVGDGRVVRYLVQEPDGTAIFVDDLETYLQLALGWVER